MPNPSPHTEMRERFDEIFPLYQNTERGNRRRDALLTFVETELERERERIRDILRTKLRTWPAGIEVSEFQRGHDAVYNSAILEAITSITPDSTEEAGDKK